MLTVGLYYIRWHYTRAVLDLIKIVQNFIWFFYEFFSIPLLLRTFFVPFYRLDEHSTKKFDPAEWAGNAIVNTLMRLVGIVLRLTLIVLGLVCILCTVVAGVFFVCAWLLAPLLMFLSFAFGFTFLFS